LSLPRLLLLDTSILLHLVRGNWIGRSIESRFRLRTRAESSLVSVITVGEVLAFGEKRNWGSLKRASLQDLLRDLMTLQISDEVLNIYAQLDTYLVQAGKAVEQNDIWIAATAIATGAHLLTTDKDFDPLFPAYLDRTWIDPQRPDA
jgi:tRNA(fMet)-specific endonuclease VapC